MEGKFLEVRMLLAPANLFEADLSGANLSNANLRDDASLEGANLFGADLSDAKGVTNEQLRAAKSLEGTTMPNEEGTITPNEQKLIEDWLKSKGKGEK